ncbi:hypothetical protein FJZ33_00535 [Candidatus Poribacteria bacterium]|nr:hypothetical protein [Candidatus Poribacteria bacterium]
MNQLSVKIYPSDLSRDEKERRLKETLEILLYIAKGEEKKTAGEITEAKNVLLRAQVKSSPFYIIPITSAPIIKNLFANRFCVILPKSVELLSIIVSLNYLF